MTPNSNNTPKEVKLLQFYKSNLPFDKNYITTQDNQRK